MLARLAQVLPTGSGWLYEPKLDGFRGLLAKDGSGVRIWSRNRRRLDPYFPELVAAARLQLPEQCVLDGEIVATDFEALQRRLARRGGSPAWYVLFDLLAVEGEDLRRRPLGERRRALEATAPVRGRLLVSVQTDDRQVASAWLEGATPAGLEGVVAKRADEPYRPGRRSWVKVKRFATMDLVVGGYVGEPGHPRSLLLGVYDDSGVLRYVGGTLPRRQGWSSDETLQPVLELTADASFSGYPGPGRRRWDSHRFEEWFPLQPVLVCEIAFSRLDGGFLRHGVRFVRWRPDKDAAECTMQAVGAV